MPEQRSPGKLLSSLLSVSHPNIFRTETSKALIQVPGERRISGISASQSGRYEDGRRLMADSETSLQRSMEIRGTLQLEPAAGEVL